METYTAAIAIIAILAVVLIVAIVCGHSAKATITPTKIQVSTDPESK